MSTSTMHTMMRGDKPLPSLEYVARLKIAAECCELAQRLVSIYIYLYIPYIQYVVHTRYTIPSFYSYTDLNYT